jgi:hypothetical protein
LLSHAFFILPEFYVIKSFAQFGAFFYLLRLNNLLPLLQRHFNGIFPSLLFFTSTPPRSLALLHFACHHPRAPALSVPCRSNVGRSSAGQSPRGEKTEKACARARVLAINTSSSSSSYRRHFVTPLLAKRDRSAGASS